MINRDTHAVICKFKITKDTSSFKYEVPFSAQQLFEAPIDLSQVDYIMVKTQSGDIKVKL